MSEREIKLPSFVWVLLCPTKILDPDGWRSKDAPDFYSEPIGVAEFKDRLMQCTVDMRNYDDDWVKHRYHDAVRLESMLATNKPAEPPLPCEEVERYYGLGGDADTNTYVLASDYDALKSENAQLRGEVDGQSKRIKVLERDIQTLAAIDLEENTVFLCAKCGYGSEEHGTLGHPAFLCVADMRQVPSRAKLTGEEPSSGGAG